MQEETDLKNARPPLGFLYENLVRSSIEIYIEAPAAAVAMICYLSIAIVACMCYIDFLPPTLFGVFCLWFFLCRKLRCLIDDSCRKHLAAMARAIFGAYRGFGVTGLMEIKTDRYGIWYRYGYKYRSKYRYRYRYGNRFRYIYRYKYRCRQQNLTTNPYRRMGKMFFSWFAWNDIEKTSLSLHRCILNVFGISAVGTATRNFMQNAPGCMSPWLGSMASRWSSAKTKHFAWLGNYRGQLQISQYRNTDFTIFGGNTSVNLSYFGVKTKGLHGFWPSKFWPFRKMSCLGCLKDDPTPGYGNRKDQINQPGVLGFLANSLQNHFLHVNISSL